jgi:hypothetical protein
MYGVRLQPEAVAPARRKWLLPMGLYYEYRWQSSNYTNYARELHARYVSHALEGTRYYDDFGNYVGQGWEIYSWLESNPERDGSLINVDARFSSWFNKLALSASSHGQYHTSLTISDRIRTTLTPLTFSKPSFNGIQFDFLSDKYAFTFLGSRVSAPPVMESSAVSIATENSTRMLAARGVADVGDFARMGVTWVNAHNASSLRSISDNSLKGTLTSTQNNGDVERVTIRITDDSPESAFSGAVLIAEHVVLDGEVHPEIVPLVRGGVHREGYIEVTGDDVLELIYDIENNFRPTPDLASASQAKELVFELVMANDYRIHITSNMQKSRTTTSTSAASNYWTSTRSSTSYQPVARARGEVRDGSNQSFVRIDYGLPTGTQVLGMDLELTDLAGLNLRAEYVANRQYRRLPNQNYHKLPMIAQEAEAYYITASYKRGPWSADGELFSMDPEYNTSAFMGDATGAIDYANQTQNLFEFVDDNDDQDEYADWNRAGQNVGAFTSIGGALGRDLEVFPGLDENQDYVSDLNQNQNTIPDYAEPFLRYQVDEPRFFFGMDMNNNTIIDRFEDDEEPDYPYERDLRGQNAYAAVQLAEGIRLTAGRLSERQLSTGRKSRATYGLLSVVCARASWRYSVFQHTKLVRDTIPNNRLRWDDATSLMVWFEDPLEAENALVNTTYLEGGFTGMRNARLLGKLKYESYHRRGAAAAMPSRRDRTFFGVITKADYSLAAGGRLSFWPRLKSVYQRSTPSLRSEPKTHSLSETAMLTGRWVIFPRMTLDLGAERNYFYNLIDRKGTLQPNYEHDSSSWVGAILVTMMSDYQGYRLTTNAGVQHEIRDLPDLRETESSIFLRLYAAISQ